MAGEVWRQGLWRQKAARRQAEVTRQGIDVPEVVFRAAGRAFYIL